MTQEPSGARESLPSEVLASLGYYVYCLRDPRDGQVFYVGKGAGARAFAHQYGTAPTTDTDDVAAVRRAKNARIAAIHNAGSVVEHIFLRIELDEVTAFVVEQAVIDAFRATGASLTNVVLGHHSHELGYLSVQDLLVRSAPPAPPLPKGSVLIKIPRWRASMTPDEECDQTRGWWPVSHGRRDHIRHIFGVVDGVIRTCYEVEGWTSQRRVWREGGKERERVQFIVRPSPLAADYLLTNVRSVIDTGDHASQWPVRFPGW